VTNSDPESHARLAFVDVVTATLSVADATEIFTTSFAGDQNNINKKGALTFSTVESEIPA